MHQHRLVANHRPDERPRFWHFVALGTIAQAVWLARRQGLLQRRITVRGAPREHPDRRLTGLPAYPADRRERTADRPTVSVIVPALNEADSIGWVLEHIPPWVTEVVLVDGLSIDRTEVVARTVVPNLVVVHQRDKGKGAALRAGFSASRCEIVAMIDADGSTDPRELDRFVDALVGGADFVKGSREMPGGGSVDFTPVRRLGNLAFVRLANIMYGTRFTDLLYGYCAFWRDGLDDLELSADGFEIETQLVVNAVKAGMTVAEVPSTELRRRAGASKLHAVSDGLRILATMMIEHPQIGESMPGEVFEMVEIERAAQDAPEWLPAGSDRRTGGDRRNGELGPGGKRYIGADRRTREDRRRVPAATVTVLVPRRGPDRRQTQREASGYAGPERRTGRDRRLDALREEAERLADSLGTDVPEPTPRAAGELPRTGPLAEPATKVRPAMSYVALITGASSGMGEATARLLRQREPHVEIILVARRQDRIDALAAELNAVDPSGHHHVHPYAADLTDPDAVAGLARYVSERFGHVNLLVNNAGARWSQSFADGGYANVAQTMAINFNAQVQLTEALLPLLRAAAAAAGVDGAAEPTASSAATHVRPSIVNVASTAARVGRKGAGAYSASKFALAGWSDSLYLELKPEGIHVGLVLPGFIATEGFPATELVSHPLKRHMVGSAEQAAAAILAAGLEHRAEIYVPGFYRIFAGMRILTPGVLRAVLGGGGFTTQTRQDAAANVSA